METSYVMSIKRSIRYWYLILLAGLFSLALGIVVFLTPLSSYMVLAFLCSISFFLGGISEIAFAISNRKDLSNSGWKFAFGLLTVLMGCIMMVSPMLTLTTLPLYVGFVVLFRAIMAIGFSIELKCYGIRYWGWLLFIGLVGLILSYILFWNPVFAGITLVYWTGFSLITLGIIGIYFAIQLNKLRKIGAA